MSSGQEHAVVVGGSVAGVLAARVLAEVFDRVTVLERDDLPDGPAVRRGVPQARHAHGLLARGAEVLEDLLPGVAEDLRRRGAVFLDLLEGVQWVYEGHRVVRAPSGITGIGVSRPLLEDRVRAHVRAQPGVHLRSATDVVSPLTRGGRVVGVRASTPDGELSPVEADLVVDATGRGSRTPRWLAELGFPTPPESVVEVGVRYTTWEFPRFPDEVPTIVGPTLRAPRFGGALAVEGDRWMVMAGGFGGDGAPPGIDGFRSFTAGLPDPAVHTLIADREFLAEGRRFRFPRSNRRHYERVSTFPEGLLVLGDAVCSYNPTYGQGITVAALQAEVLRRELARGPANLARRFFAGVAAAVDTPWELAAGGDLRHAAVPGTPSLRQRVAGAYVGRVQAAAATDPDVARALLRVVNLLDRPEHLFAPSLVRRVLGPAARSRGAVSRPRSWQPSSARR